MSFNKDLVVQALRNFNFEDLFIDGLGWDLARSIQPVEEDIGEGIFVFNPIAEKRGLVVFLCEVLNEFPPHAIRKKLDSRIAKTYREHFVIFVDQKKTHQLWQWVWREPGRPLISRTHEYSRDQPGESLIQKLEPIAFTLDEEETLNIVEVSGRLRASFNVEPATRRFYDLFKKERAAFEDFISGIKNIETKREYVSVMLNRLMFIYFIQRKGFLDEDRDYLRNRMAMTREKYGDDQFYSFYSYFLLRLFHEALGSLKRNSELEELIGDVPYLNGGIFEIHQIEIDNPDIQIPDDAFEQVLDFFDQYQWHLDDRPLRADNEINPDVLGYVFEKYINQKQMGAYYTKEDITEYISNNTIVPYLFDAAKQNHPKAFTGDDSIWILLEADPLRYIYEAVQKGVGLALPQEIAVGIVDVSKRGIWNTRTHEDYALPTEIWRETVARRQRFDEVKTKLENGEIREINDLITCNLDIQQFAQDVIETCDKPETLRAFWKAIRGITILDPACGSGAFLFAALNILHPLYEACLTRMQTFIDEYPEEAPAHALKDFKNTFANVSRHPNEDYFILKSIIVDNLFGVDIMAEAVEIAKLRLFLKLAAQVEPDRDKENWGIEPLPDIDFNIRHGNSLVGFAIRDDVTKVFIEGKGKGGATQEKLFLIEDENESLRDIEIKANDIDRLYKRFRELQITYDISSYSEDYSETKSDLSKRLLVLGNELDIALAKQYGIEGKNNNVFTKWRDNHKPFHWFIEFYGIISKGGFDVVIGNPPYVQYNQVSNTYKIINYVTEESNNLFVYFMERSLALLHKGGKLGMILPISLVSIDYTSTLRKLLSETFCQSWYSNFAIRPAKLFEGVEQRLSIFIGNTMGKDNKIFSSKYWQWYKAERPSLFQNLYYSDVSDVVSEIFIPKAGSKVEKEIIKKFQKTHKRTTEIYLSRNYKSTMFFHRTPGYWIRMTDFEPYFRSPTSTRSVYHIRELHFSDSQIAKFCGALVSSSLYMFYFFATGNCRNLTLDEVRSIPIGVPSQEMLNEVSSLYDHLMRNYQENSEIKRRGQTEFQEFNWPAAKPVVDELDMALGKHFNIPKDEMDFIINYDIKIRMGDELYVG